MRENDDRPSDSTDRGEYGAPRETSVLPPSVWVLCVYLRNYQRVSGVAFYSNRGKEQHKARGYIIIERKLCVRSLERVFYR